jgi:hypothetical protein
VMDTATRKLTLTIELAEATKWDSNSLAKGKVEYNYQWTEEQWRWIEATAFKVMVGTFNGTIGWEAWEDVIPPDVLEYLEDGCSEDLFKGQVTGDEDPDENEWLNASATVIGVVDAFIGQMEEECNKRDGALP